MKALPLRDRSCGPCTACCRLLPVFELRKRHHESCLYLCVNGCGIYTHRPPRCASYQCEWLAGRFGGDEQQRPDRIGVMLSRSRRWADILWVWELWDGAAQSEQVRALLEELYSDRDIHVCKANGTDAYTYANPESTWPVRGE